MTAGTECRASASICLQLTHGLPLCRKGECRDGEINDMLASLPRPGAAEQIIRLLAGYDAPLRDAPYTDPDDCALCTGKGSQPAGHDETCPWRMAREHMRGITP